MTNLRAEELDEETLKKLGLKLPSALSEVGANLAVLGRVFTALKALEDDDALRVLQQAQMYILSRKNGANIDSTQIPGASVPDSYAPPLDWTLKMVAKVYKIKPADLKSRKRDANIVEARQVAMYVLGMSTKYSFTQIGQDIGGWSPASVSHAFSKISYKVKEDPELREKVQEIQKLRGV